MLKARTKVVLQFMDKSHDVFIKYGNKLYLYNIAMGMFLVGLWNRYGYTFYFDMQTLSAKTGWMNVEGNRYYFDPKTFTSPKDGFYTIGGTRYLFGKMGEILTGFNKVKGRIYYTDKLGRVFTGWHTINGNRYYFDENKSLTPDYVGAAYTGWYQDLSNGKAMYFHPDGRMAKGITQIGNDTYMFVAKNNGMDKNFFYKQTGFYSVTGLDRYYFDPANGGKAAKSKWIKTDKGYVYLQSDGRMAKGQTVINGETYVFTKDADKNYYSKQAPLDWKVGLRFKLHSKNNPSKKDWWEITLACRDGKVKLEGRTDIPSDLTFDDKFTIGFEKQGNNARVSTPIVFRACNSASAGDALNRAMKIFNDADIKVGDKIFMSGEKYQDSLRFTNTGYIKGITGNDYSKGYQKNRIDQFSAGFAVAKNGLYEAIVEHRNLVK